MPGVVSATADAVGEAADMPDEMAGPVCTIAGAVGGMTSDVARIASDV